jgi:hypothetical protein
LITIFPIQFPARPLSRARGAKLAENQDAVSWFVGLLRASVPPVPPTRGLRESRVRWVFVSRIKDVFPTFGPPTVLILSVGYLITSLPISRIRGTSLIETGLAAIFPRQHSRARGAELAENQAPVVRRFVCLLRASAPLRESRGRGIFVSRIKDVFPTF